MQTLGVWLRQAREARGATLKEAEEATHIRVRFLEALEVWNLAAFPGGDVQIRGFLRIYARYLGLSPDQVLSRYTAEAQGGGVAAPTAPRGAKPAISSSSTSRPRWMSAERLIVASILLVLLPTIAVGGWYYFNRWAGGGEAAPTATAPAESASTPLVPQTSPLVTPTFPANPDGGVTLALEAIEHVWARVTVDGTPVFEGMLAPEQAESWSGQETVIVDTGNGAGLQVTVNGQPQGPMCGRGETCRRGWGADGEIAVSPLTPTTAP
ncbi:MAG: hypothetical protein DRI81_09145 [Chloroflexi bacterium]|nr:MAG: hypothetical protein DRI81_09145 [Chloroflexota bacterium]